jgi:hypothetical protein
VLLFNLLLALQQASPEFALPRTNTPPTIDGSLASDEWAGALELANWVQTKPGDNISPEGRTIAWISYDQANLYIGIRAWDDRSKLRYRLHERDAITQQGQDWISIQLDTFNDRRRAFALAVNPLGVQGDGVDIEGGGFTEWDGTFDTSGRILEDGWSIEVRIPFSTLRYPGAAEQRWGLSLSRNYGRVDMTDSPWSRDRDLACNLCQMATLTGIRDIQGSRSVEFNPILVARGGSARPDLPEPFGEVSGEVEPGANIKVGLSRGLTLDGTVNPDFSQVEADAGQLALNNRFALFFPEKRPFFLESGDVFQVRIPLQGQDPGFWQPPTSLIYTRQIVDPTVGTKLSGKAGDVRLGVIGALDAYSGYEWDETIGGVPGDSLDPFSADRAEVAIARAAVDVLADGYVGATGTYRAFGDGWSWTGAADTRLRFGDNVTLQAIAATSETREADVAGAAFAKLSASVGAEGAQAALDSLPSEALAEDGEERSGQAVQTQLTFQDRYWTVSAAYTDVTTGYETRLGFTPRTDVLQGSGFLAYTWRGTGWLQELKPGIYVDRAFAHEDDRIGSAGKRTDQTLRATLDATFGAGMYGGVGYTQAYVRFDGTEFPGIDRGYVYVGGRPTSLLTFDLFASFGEDVIYSNVVDDQGALAGSYIRSTASVGLRPLPPVRIDLSVAASRVWRRSAEHSKESLYGESAIPRAVLRTQFTRRFGLRLIGEYRIERFFQRDGALYDQYETMVLDVLGSYLIYPNQSVLVGWTQAGEGTEAYDRRWTQRGGLVKLSYVWRF